MVKNPQSGRSSVLGGGEFVVIRGDLMVNLTLLMGSLQFQRPLWTSDRASSAEESIRDFARSTSEDEALKFFRSERHVNLETVAPSDFFGRGSQMAGAKILEREVRGAEVRLRLESHTTGDRGTVWIDVEKAQIVRAAFDRESHVESPKVR
jgi:hypothetical protein